MSLKNGVCAIVLSKQDGLEHVLGMGILVAKREVVTCAHVITAALVQTGSPSPGRPFTSSFRSSPPPRARASLTKNDMRLKIPPAIKSATSP